MRIVFELKRGEQAEVILNNLYKHTQLQIGFGIIMLSIVNGQPRELGLIDMHQVLHRPPRRCGPPAHRVRTAQGARARAHFARLPEGAGQPGRSDPPDPRRQESRAKPARRLIAAFQFSEKQAQAIIELQLQRLTGMEQQKILDELADIQRRIAEYLEILGSDKVLRDADHQGTEGSPEGLRRRAPHPDHRRHGRDQARRPGGGGRRGGHGDARRLSEAHRASIPTAGRRAAARAASAWARARRISWST